MDNTQKALKLKIAITWLAVLLLGCFMLALGSASDPITLSVFPEVPREGEPVMVTFSLNNPSARASTTSYQFYANGELLKQGTATISPMSAKRYQYIYENPLPIGEQINFMLQVTSAESEYRKTLSLPAYPPQIWSSFISFASFSTSVMSSMSSMVYYQGSFGSMGLNVGLVSSLVLMALLTFLEVTRIKKRKDRLTILGSLRIRFSTLSTVLFIIFIGMVFTRAALLLAS